MIGPIQAINLSSDPRQLILGEWLVSNGLGGYASSTIVGVMTRKYHALLVAALPQELGRMIMFNHLVEELVRGDKTYLLNCEEKKDGELNIDALHYLKSFSLDHGLPVWRYQIEEIILEKRIFMTYKQNTVYIFYTLIEGPEKVFLKLFPSLHFRSHESPVNLPIGATYKITAIENRYEISQPDLPPLKMYVFGNEPARFTIESKYIRNIFFRTESWRGYEAIGDLWNPGYFEIELSKEQEVGILASTESWKKIDALNPYKAKEAEILRKRALLHLAAPRDVLTSDLVLAADQFLVTPESREEDTVRAHARGDEVRTVIAGYHWFTDWGRDTMISLEGLTLCTGRSLEGRWILKTFSQYVRDGLIPNLFPEGENEGLYHTADATLWFFHAIERYISCTQDPLILEELLPTLREIMHFHIKGTRFGIGMDRHDKLLKQGAEKYQLTWMDAKVGDWIVTPRRGKSVEINALWYNALRLMEEWSLSSSERQLFSSLAEEVYRSFNKRFWIEEKRYLYDVIDGEEGQSDTSFRPNQLFAISLKYAVLEQPRWQSVVEQCEEELLTPFGLRTLSPRHPDYKAYYEGDLRARDAAYHQGTVWPWLIGPFMDAWLKVYPQKRQEARHFLESFQKHLKEAGIGTISEIFDASAPYAPRGCMAQAWSVAEVLRCWLKVSQEAPSEQDLK